MTAYAITQRQSQRFSEKRQKKDTLPRAAKKHKKRTDTQSLYCSTRCQFWWFLLSNIFFSTSLSQIPSFWASSLPMLTIFSWSSAFFGYSFSICYHWIVLWKELSLAYVSHPARSVLFFFLPCGFLIKWGSRQPAFGESNKTFALPVHWNQPFFVWLYFTMLSQ